MRGLTRREPRDQQLVYQMPEDAGNNGASSLGGILAMGVGILLGSWDRPSPFPRVLRRSLPEARTPARPVTREFSSNRLRWRV